MFEEKTLVVRGAEKNFFFSKKGVGKGRATKKKELFWNFFYFAPNLKKHILL